jgi:26S proteasome regulatory subunit N7
MYLTPISSTCSTSVVIILVRRYYMREVCVVAFTQFLESYRSVTLEAMAVAFGVTPEFLDHELADLISSKRIPATIDRVAGVVETNRPDAKNALYQMAIKQGDALLNKLQKLSKVVDIE